MKALWKCCARRRNPRDPILRLIWESARILWSQNERQNAISLLNAALERFPNDVHLLMQLASCLIENDQFEDARQYIALAETIAPSHRAILQVRQLIAQKMGD